MSERVDAAQMRDEAAFRELTEAGHVTGQVVCVDGGQSQYHPLMAVRL